MPPAHDAGTVSLTDREWAALARLADTAIDDFGVTCFWSVSGARDLEPLLKAKLAGRLLQKHGGIRGLRAAARIEAELRAIGETPWR